MKNTLNWYTLYTRPRCENKVMAQLAKIGVESYCPFRKIDKSWNRKIRKVEEPLFKCYVFAKIPAQQVEEMRLIEGVINVLHWQEEPAAIPDTEIEMIRKFLFDFADVKLEKILMNPSESINIVNAPETTISDHAIELKYTDIRISLPTLGYSIIASRDKPGTETIAVISNKTSMVPVAGADGVEL